MSLVPQGSEGTVALTPDTIRSDLVDLRTREGATIARVKSARTLYCLPAVRAAFYENGADPERLPRLTLDVLKCEVENGSYVPNYREILLKTLNFEHQVSDLGVRRQKLMTKLELTPTDYARQENDAYDEFAAVLYELPRSKCFRDEAASRWRDTALSFQAHLDRHALAAFEQMLRDFGFDRDPFEVAEIVRKLVEELPGARNAVVSRYPKLSDAQVLDEILDGAISVAYPVWLGLERVLRDDHDIYVTRWTLRGWSRQAGSSASGRHQTSLAEREQEYLTEGAPQDGLDLKTWLQPDLHPPTFLYWDRDPSEMPELFSEGNGDEREAAQRRFEVALERSLSLLAVVLLALESINDWDYVLRSVAMPAPRPRSPLTPPD